MPLTTDEKMLALSRDVIQGFDKANGGIHPGFRPAHAKGLLLDGVFRPSSEAAALTRAPHVQRDSTPVTVRFSDFAGIPTVADNDPQNASPRGFAIRFHLAEHSHTDIVAHSVDSFPTRTTEGFLEFLNALIATDPAGPHPNAIEQFLSAHPAALTFVQTPKPIPTSFAKESFFAVSAFKFTNADGVRRYGRYRVLPVAGNEYLDEVGAAAQTPNFLFDEIEERVAKGPVKFRIVVQLATFRCKIALPEKLLCVQMVIPWCWQRVSGCSSHDGAPRISYAGGAPSQRPMLMRLSAMTPSPTHRLIPSAPW